MALIFSDLQKFGAQTSTFLDNPQEANFLILTLSSKGMADFLQKISSSKIGVFEDFTQTPQYKDLGSCLIVNFKAYPAKYLIVLPELIDESVAYDCVVLGALFYLSYPPSLLKQKYLPLQRSFYLTGVEYSMLCLRNKGVSHFAEFDVAKLSDIEEMKLGFARYIGCKSPGE